MSFMGSFDAECGGSRFTGTSHGISMQSFSDEASANTDNYGIGIESPSASRRNIPLWGRSQRGPRRSSVSHSALFGFRSPMSNRKGSLGIGQEESIASDYGAWWRMFGSSYNNAANNDDLEDCWFRERWATATAYSSKFWATCWEQKYVPISAFLFFIVLCGCGTSTVLWYFNREEQNNKMAAEAIAISLASSLAAQIDLVLLPMFVLAIDATNNEEIFNSGISVEQWPFQSETHRDPQPVEDAYASFNRKSASLLGLVNTSDAIISLQLAPCGVVSFVNPLEGNEKAIGHDLLADPARIPDAVRAIRARELVMAGPIPLVQGGTMMIGRLPIFVEESSGVGLDTRNIPQISEEVYPGHRFWGFSVSLLNFQTLMEETNFEEELKNHHMRFNLTRTNRVLAENGTVVETHDVVASSRSADGGEAEPVEGVEVTVELHNEFMTLAVTCPNGCTPTWMSWALAVAVLGSWLMAVLLLVFLVTRAQHLSLLHKMLPRKAIKRINRGKQVIDEFPSVSIFFSDIVGFTSMAGNMAPVEVMKMLNDLYMEFDKLVAKHDVYKVETIGDAYMVVGGAPTRLNGAESAFRVTSFALDALDLVKDWQSDARKVQIRCGVHSGPVVAGVVGTAMPRYCFFGDTVNTASRMESTSEQGKLQLSSSAVGNLQVWCQQKNQWPFRVRSRAGKLNVKGKGHMDTYWVERKRNDELFGDGPTSWMEIPPIIAETDSASSTMHEHQRQVEQAQDKGAAGEPSAAPSLVPSLEAEGALNLTGRDLHHRVEADLSFQAEVASTGSAEKCGGVLNLKARGQEKPVPLVPRCASGPRTVRRELHVSGKAREVSVTVEVVEATIMMQMPASAADDAASKAHFESPATTSTLTATASAHGSGSGHQARDSSFKFRVEDDVNNGSSTYSMGTGGGGSCGQNPREPSRDVDFVAVTVNTSSSEHTPHQHLWA